MRPHLIMPMGGAGSRFYKDGYECPKPLIKLHGRPFFYWSARSVCSGIEVQDLTFVVLEEHVTRFRIEEEIYAYFPDARIRTIERVLPGPVYTAREAVSDMKDGAAVIVNDCDHMFGCSRLWKDMKASQIDFDAALLAFQSDLPQYSYIKYDESGKIAGVAEKDPVSQTAVSGAYIFKNADLFMDASGEAVKTALNEVYMSSLYNVISGWGLSIKKYDTDFHVEFGTPAEYESAKNAQYFQIFKAEDTVMKERK